MHLSELKSLHITELLDRAQEIGIENAQRMRKQELMFAIIKKRARAGEQVFDFAQSVEDGVLGVDVKMDKGHREGFLENEGGQDGIMVGNEMGFARFVGIFFRHGPESRAEAESLI